MSSTTKKPLKDLPKEIYSLFDPSKETKVNEEYFSRFCQDLRQSFERHFAKEEPREFYLRMSNIGWRPRRLWFEANNPTSEHISDVTRMRFILGDLYEALMKFLVRQAGYEVTDEQKEVSISGIKGHLDGRVNGVLTDFKSASPDGFKKFVFGDIKDGIGGFGEVYAHQIASYAHAEGDEEVAFIAQDKSSGEIVVLELDNLDLPEVPKRLENLKKVITQPEPPAEKCYVDVEDGKSGNRKLQPDCTYCPYKEECWKDTNGGRGLRKFSYKSGRGYTIKYLTHVEKEPTVPEIGAAIVDDFADE